MRDVFVLHGEYGPGLPFGCTHIRLLRPLTHPSVAGGLALAHGTRLPSGSRPDLVVVERLPPGPPDLALAEAERLIHELGARAIPYVYATDDNILDLHRDRPWGLPAGAEIRAAVRLLARRAARVVVSTEALRERMRGLNPRTVTVPNFLDERLFGPPEPPRSPGDPLVVGYMGTRTHDGDLRMILRPLREVLERGGGRVRLEVVGVADADRLSSYFEGLPVSQLDPGAAEAYPHFPGWMRRSLRWDFAVAPLADDPFARCKSDLKYLDYGALAIPGVFSDVRPYRETVRNRETGLVVPNAPDAWAAALEEMASDATLRARLALAARDDVYGTRMLAANAARWVEALS
ncbi:MAG TPA: glycosyltransferase [Thermoanaerobaculia bacterium]|nr:glycosyltransferase [Thermoanaerobaculia bacterium]